MAVATHVGAFAVLVMRNVVVGSRRPYTGACHPRPDASSPPENVRAGAAYLRWLLDAFNENLTLALAAYNAGEHAVMRFGNKIPPFRETREYVPKVLRAYHRLKART